MDSDTESWYGEGDDQDREENRYCQLLQKLAEKWLLVEISHNASKEASNMFWEAAISLLPQVLREKEMIGISRKIPQFVHLRRKLHKRLLPPINQTTAFKDRSGNVVVVEGDATKEYSTSTHTKLYESIINADT